jgi:alpha-beta hydrolase superfamily lysophospholipase
MSFFQSSDGTQLHERIWPAEGQARGAIVLVHGYGEHIGRYDEVGRGLAAAGFNVRGYDQRGHGQSGGVRGYCDRFQQFVDDLALVVERARDGQLPVFILAHSFGALVAPFFALQHPTALTGMVLSSPWWKNAVVVSPGKVLAGKIASRLYGKLALPSGLKGADCTRDPELAALYDRDPLNNKNATARWYTEATAAQQDLVARAPQVTTPILVMAGEADKLSDATQAPIVFDRLGSKDKTLRMLASQYHEILNEPRPTREQNLAQMVEWLRAHASATHPATGGKLRASEA